MSAAKTESKPDANTYRITGGLWASAWKVALAVGIAGLAAAAAGGMNDHKRVAYSYLFAFVFFLTIGLGCTFFVLVQRLTSANWSVTVRRTAEFFMSGLPVMALLFIPIILLMPTLYPWFHPEEHATNEAAVAVAVHEEHPSVSASPPHESTDELAERIEHQTDAQMLRSKAWYLNTGFYWGRVVFYFLVWFVVSRRLFDWSVKQDESKDLKLTVQAQRFSPVAAILCALTLTFAGFDWVMSLYPFWYSTIFGVWFFAGGFVAAHALITLVTLSLRDSGFTGKAITVEHYHDLGKLTFGFLVFWAYISFAQFFLIWYAAIPEETIFYHFRWGDGPWKTVSLLILFVHFVLPFFVLLSRNTKRYLPSLAVGCAIVLVMHLVEMYWAVMPNYVATPEQHIGDALSLHWLDVACLLGVGGVYLAWVFLQMTKHSLIPVGDPRLKRSLAFENA